MLSKTTNRRAILAGIAAAPALSVPALASGTDAELLALDDKMEFAHRRVLECSQRMSEANHRYEAQKALLGPQPEAPKPPKEYWELCKRITVGEFGMLSSDHPLRVWDREIDTERSAFHAAEHAKFDRMHAECGVLATEEEMDILAGEAWEIGEQIFSLRAHTLQGMMVKIRAAEYLEIDAHEGGGGNVLGSLIDDIRGLAGLAS